MSVLPTDARMQGGQQRAVRNRRTLWLIDLSAGLLVCIVGSGWYAGRAVPVFPGFAAKTLCFGVFVSNRRLQDVRRLNSRSADGNLEGFFGAVLTALR